MKLIALTVLVTLSTALSPGAGFPAEEETRSPRRRVERGEVFERRRHRPEDVEFKEFREQIGRLGRLIRRNRRRVEALEEELAVAPEAERAAIQSRLDEALRERAVLKFLLARHRLRLTERALEIAQSRHQEAVSRLEESRESILEQWPDIDLDDLPEIVPLEE